MLPHPNRCARALGWFALLGATTGLCLAQRYPFQLYGQAEGLTNLVPLAVMQDSSGFLWAGTQNGLFRYDGSRFESFGIAHSLPSSRISSLYETPGGSLLVATSSGMVRSSGVGF